MKKVIIAGQEIVLVHLQKEDLKGVYIDALVRFNFYRGAIGDNSFLLLEHKKSENLRPLQYKQIALKIGKVIPMPILFEFDRMEAFQRNRFIGHGIYFVVSDKYVFLPFLMINSNDRVTINADKLSPVAQYIILRQIQKNEFNGASVKDIERLCPYKYVTLTRAVRILEELGLCEVTVGSDKIKRLQFASPKELWDATQRYLINPVQKVVYCTRSYGGAVCSYNALSYYTNLNPDNIGHYAIYEKEYKEWAKCCQDINAYEGDVEIQVWKYPPIEREYVDRLSLYLTLKDDMDPRVEKELEMLINEVW